MDQQDISNMDFNASDAASKTPSIPISCAPCIIFCATFNLFA